MNMGKAYKHVFQAEPFPWQTGDPFWDGFTLTHELQPLPNGEVQMIYHVEAATQAQVDRFLELTDIHARIIPSPQPIDFADEEGFPPNVH